MAGSRSRVGRLAIALALCALASGGCASWQLPRIDPSGEHILIWPQTYPVAGPTYVGPPATAPLMLGNPPPTAAPVGHPFVLKTTGPRLVTAGAVATYAVEVTNQTNLPARGLVLQIAVPNGLSHLASTPKASLTGRQLRWQIDQIAAGRVHSVRVDFRVEGQGTIDVCSSLTLPDGQQIRDCASTRVAGPAVDLRVTGPDRAEVGSNVRFEVLVANRGDAEATGLVIKDTFDEGLEHVKGASPIERELGRLAAGAESRIYINFRVTRAGSICHTVEVFGDDGIRASARRCLAATDSVSAAPPPAVPAESQAAVKVSKKTLPDTRRVGDKAEFEISVTNTGDVPLTNLRITDTYELALHPTNATEGFQLPKPGDEQLVWQLAKLAPGGVYRLEVHCQCVAAAALTVNRVVVTCDQLPPIGSEARLKILPAPSRRDEEPPAAAGPQPAADNAAPPAASPLEPTPPKTAPLAAATDRREMADLTVQVADLDDPVKEGGRVMYQILVRNRGSASDFNVALTVRFPESLTAAEVGTRAPVRYQVEAGAVVFEPVAEVRPEETMTYLVPFHAGRPGRVELTAELASRQLASPLTVKEDTEVLGNESP